jgi:translocation and assembly module TamB
VGRAWVAVGVLAAASLGLLVATASALRSSAFESWAARLAAQALADATGQPASVGRVRVDLGGVTAQEVRLGAGVLKVRQVRVDWDPWRLALSPAHGRSGVDAVRRIVLDRPIFALVRDPRGRWNLEEFFRPTRAAPGRPAEALRAEVQFREGTVYFLDRQAGGFRALVSGLEGRLVLSDLPLLRLELSGSVRAGPSARASASGWVHVQEASLDLAVEVDGLPVRPWADYLLPDPRWRGLGGQVTGRFQLYGNASRLQVRAAAQLAAVRVHLVREGITLQAVRGAVGVDGPLVSLRGLRVRVRGSEFSVHGQVRLAGSGAVALEVEAHDADLTLLGRLLPSVQVAAKGRLAGRVRVLGPLDAVRVEGNVRMPLLDLGSLRLEDARGRLHYGSGLLSLTESSARVAGGAVSADVSVALSSEPSFLAVGEFAQVPSEVAAALGLELPLRARLSGAVVAVGTPAGPEASGVVTASAGSVLGHRVDGLEAVFGYEQDTLTLTAARAWRGETSVWAWGRIHGTSLELDVVARALPAADVVRATGLRLGAGGSLHGAGRLGGNTRSPTFAGHVLWEAGRAGPLAFDTATADILASPDRVEASRLGWLDGPAVYRGFVALQGEDVRAHVSATGARVERLLGLAGVDLPVAGELYGELDVHGTIRSPWVTGRAVLLEGRAAAFPVDRAQTRFTWTPAQLALQGLQVHSDALQLRAEGVVDKGGTLRLQAEVDPLVLEELAALRNPYLRLAGNVRLRGEVTGTVQQPRVEVEVDGARVRVNGQRFDHVGGRVVWVDGALVADPVQLELGRAAYTLHGRLGLRPEPVADLVLDVRNARVQTLLAVAGVFLDADGRLSGRLRLTGPLSNPRAELDVSLVDGRYQRYPIPSGSGRLALEDGRVELREVELVARQGRIRAQGFVDLRGQSEVEVGGVGLEAEALRQALRLRPPLSGTVDFTVQFTGTPQDPTVGLALEARDLGVGQSGADRVTAQAFYRSGYLELEHVLVEEAGHRLRARGRLPLDPRTFSPDPAKPVQLEVSTDRADLSVLQTLLPGIQSAQGPFEASVRVGGTVAAPALEGFLRAEGGRVQLAGVAPALEDISVDLTFDQARARLRRFRADVGGGVVEAVGEATFENLRPQRYAVDVSASRARLEVLRFFRGHVDGRLALRGTLQRAELSGRLALSAGDLVVAVPPPGAGGGQAGFPVALDVDVVAGEGLHVVAGPVRLAVTGAVHVGGTAAGPALSGTVTGRGGEYRAFGTTFVVEEGTAVFQEFRGLEPVVSARARTRVADVTVFVHVAGTPGQMQVSLSSDPELPHDRIVQLLAAQAGIQQALAGDVEALLRQQLARFLLGEFEVRLRQLLGLSELRIEYDFEQPLRLRLGRFLVENLYLTLTTVFDTQTRFLWALEYRFARHYALVFSHDTLGVWMVLLRANFTW